MGNPLSPIVDEARKLGHAVAAGASEVKDELFGKPGTPVPAPPSFDWESTYKGIGTGWATGQREQHDLRKQEAETQEKYAQGQLSEQGLKQEVEKLNLKRLTRQGDLIDELMKLDMTSPDAPTKKEKILTEYTLLSGKPISSMSGKERWATSLPQQIALAEAGWRGSISQLYAEGDEATIGKYEKALIDYGNNVRTSVKSEIDPVTGMPRVVTTHSQRNLGVPPPPGSHGTVPPPPGAHASGGTTSKSGGSSKFDTPQIRAAYDRLMKGGNVTGPLANYAVAYAKDKGLPEPHQANKIIDTQVKSVQDAESRLNMMEGDAQNPNGPNDIDLLWNHLGMTAAGQKGVRVTKNIIEEAVNARPIGEMFGVKWHKLKDGTLLSPEQRAHFIDLARRRTLEEQLKLADIQKNQFGEAGDAAPAAAVPALVPPGWAPPPR